MLNDTKKALWALVEKNQFHSSFVGAFVNPFWLCRRELFRTLQELAPGLSGTVLDFGCGSGPYRRLLCNASAYIGLEYDTPANRAGKSADIFYDGLTIPLGDSSVDSILSTQTLEHVPNPERITEEWHRVLCPGGRVLLTVPFMWPEHEMPYDYQRYTTNGLRHLLERKGFSILDQRRLLADCRTPAQLLLAWLYDALRFGVRSPKTRLLLTFLLCAPIALLAEGMAVVCPKNMNTYMDNVILAEKFA
ncbi:class I SAM-dependent methyltransferase [Nitratidesulfovibrio sp. SRB-5]|uniref:class I SAM-dependent methyltransferase n=1 Tax=Nitratidesulfovibrio sp. SRB-5 TaxID=2872636 RepID=UPI0010254D24|nr:class I SAM-dependent methyltransferase [Nitratidesulfovibrio sp. SRB-5]MBZ2170880.1 class I SAM-dependent methyltransferase [Nitratidesulfovibrio sp. SRB-5]RXF78123.1 class I SAM-dependent methyltransferase [Desulfovibrio sp. DS-1]